jgi:RNA polymerase sigma factor (sigma-70 family)
VLSDEALARRAAKEDSQAFAAIFRRYHQSLYRFCLGIVGNSEDAQDALQSTMVKVLRALPGEERQIELKPWLYRIAHNESIDLLRRRREMRQVDPDLAAPGSGLAEEAAVRERLRRLIADLEELPERQRGTLVMRELAGLDFAEIGAALGTSAAVARQTLYEARLSLRQMDEGRGMSCATVAKALSDGDGRVARRRDVRAHLRTCASCRRFREEIGGRERDLAALSPLPAMAAAGLLQGLLGGGGGAGGGGLAAALGGGAANSIGASAVLKGAAAVALVGVLGVGAADRGGLIDLGLPGAGGSEASEIQRSPGVDQQRLQLTQVIGAPGAGSRAAAPTEVDSGGEAGAAAGADRDARAEVPATTGEAASPDGDAPNPVEVQGDAGVGGEKTNATGTTEPPVEGSTEGSAEDPPATPRGGKGSPAATPKGKSKGKDHAKDLPSASEHGQQTAAANKGAEHGSSGSPKGQAKGQHESPSKPVHPEHPSTPSVENGPPPGATVREEHSQAPATPPGQEKEKGKKSQVLP